MVKFIHTADWQIGMKAAHVGAVGQKVRSARLESAKRAVDAAAEHSADFIIVAGDTFEDNAVDRVLVQRVADILGSFSGPVYIISGNHDPLVPGSVWEHAAWQSHSNLNLLTQPTPVEIEGATLYPCPLFEKYSSRDPTRWIEASDDDRIAIGLAHGTVEGVLQNELDYPIARDSAARSKLDYLALGHWHSFSTYDASDGIIRMAYSGTHETTKFGERDSGNVLLVEIEERGGAPKLTPIQTGCLVWTKMEETLSDVGDIERVREQIESMPGADSTLVDLRLDGILHHEDQAELVRIDELIRARFLFGRMESAKLAPSPTDDSWLDGLHGGVMQSVAKCLQALSNPVSSVERPQYATPEVASRALLDLYRLVQENEE